MYAATNVDIVVLVYVLVVLGLRQVVAMAVVVALVVGAALGVAVVAALVVALSAVVALVVFLQAVCGSGGGFSECVWPYLWQLRLALWRWPFFGFYL